MRKLSLCLLFFILCLMLVSCAKEGTVGIGIHHAKIEIENYGVIEVELDGDTAPITVKNFMDLANGGFYDGLTFHRIIDGFMIQGGSPSGDNYGNNGNFITGEFSSNGYENNISHTRGTLSMARGAKNNSASCQFFIVHKDSPHLDGDYAAFGRVISGIDIVDKICAETPVLDFNGTVTASDQPKIKSITIID